MLNVIVGPTAAGKSALAMELARHFNLALISADSRQVYRCFDIGTAKPNREEQSEIPHFGIDVKDAVNRYSAHEWASSVPGWITQAKSLGKSALIVGGTGFYLRALVRPLAPAPDLDETRRAQLEAWFNAQDLETLRRWCERLDPARAHLGRTQLLRAVETALLSGERLGDVHASHNREGASQADPSPIRYLVVDPGAPLAERIRTRVQGMVQSGWIDEVRSLMSTVPPTAPAWLASGYDVMRQHVAGVLSRDAAIERVVIETRQYAKRQRTWFRHQITEGPVTRISPDEPHALDQAIAWMNGMETDAS
ncbi:MAG: tRNA (adenosine(37)-N6)-dimethylallyltransferase MiaA [Gemmatimonadaceae bacterium]